MSTLLCPDPTCVDVGKGHLALWNNGVHHRDISASNLMCKGEGDNLVGVLNDFDLATTQSSDPMGNQRTGTIPFMARSLLARKGSAGELKHIYAHDAESFIWVLVWVCLRYNNGKLLQRPPLDDWLKADALRCAEKKSHFLLSVVHKELEEMPGVGHERNWRVAEACLDALKEKIPADTGDYELFQRLLYRPYTEVTLGCGGGRVENERSSI